MTEAAHGRIRRHLWRRSDRNGVFAGDSGSNSTSPRSPAPAAPSNLGPAFDERVAEALRRQQPPGSDADYDLVRSHLDVAHYLLQAPDVLADPEVDPVRHFLDQGADAKLTPEPNFSTESYLKRHPERRAGRSHPYVAWLREGRAAGEIGEPVMGIQNLAKVLGTSREDVARNLSERRSDVQERLHHGKLGEMFAKAVEVEPLIGDLWPETARPRMMPIGWLVVADQLGALYASQEALGFRRARVVLVVGDPADPFVTRLLRGFLAEVPPDDVVIVSTTPGSATTGATPPDVRVVDFAETARRLGPLMAQHVLVELLRSLCAEVIVGVGSRVLLESLTPYGRALRQSERIYLGFTSPRRGHFGQEIGPARRFFYRHVDLVEGVLVDTAAMAVSLIEGYQLPDDTAAKVRSIADDRVLATMVDRMLRSRDDGS